MDTGTVLLAVIAVIFVVYILPALIVQSMAKRDDASGIWPLLGWLMGWLGWLMYVMSDHKKILCTNCGKPINPNWATCHNCGKALEDMIGNHKNTRTEKQHKDLYETTTASVGETHPRTGKYSINHEVGRGGMGIVYEAIDNSLKRKVVLKKLRDELKVSRKDKERFIKEAQMVAQLKHANIVDIYEIYEEDGDTYIAFEYIDGKTLAQLMEERAYFTWLEARPIIKQLCDALQYAHAKSIIHRDLKPANIMLTTSGQVKVMDFGIAREMKNTVLKHSALKDSSGTIIYMAPEQHIGEGDERSDVFSLGVTIYEMLTGDVPFKGADLFEAKKMMAFKPVSAKQQGLPLGVDALIGKALQFDEGARFKCVAELAVALANV